MHATRCLSSDGLWSVELGADRGAEGAERGQTPRRGWRGEGKKEARATLPGASASLCALVCTRT